MAEQLPLPLPDDPDPGRHVRDEIAAGVARLVDYHDASAVLLEAARCPEYSVERAQALNRAASVLAADTGPGAIGELIRRLAADPAVTAEDYRWATSQLALHRRPPDGPLPTPT